MLRPLTEGCYELRSPAGRVLGRFADGADAMRRAQKSGLHVYHVQPVSTRRVVETQALHRPDHVSRAHVDGAQRCRGEHTAWLSHAITEECAPVARRVY